MRQIAQVELRKRRARDNRELTLGEWLPRRAPHRDWTPAHIQFLIAKLEQVSSGEVRRLAISAPPRHGKSETCTRWYPVARFSADPQTRVCLGSTNQDTAVRFGRQVRKIAQRILPGLSKERAAAQEWELSAGGVFRSTGVGSPPIGDGFNLLVIDDPFKDYADARSAARRAEVWDWFDGVMRNRVEPGGAIIVIHTRWHQDDLIGRLREREPEKWEFVNLTATAEEDDVLGREFGEPLWPARWPLEALEEAWPADLFLRRALFFGQPSTREGNYLPTTKIRTVTLEEWWAMLADPDRGDLRDLSRVRYWDIAGTASATADYTVGDLLAGPDRDGWYYLEDSVRGQWGPKERNRVILKTAKRDGPTVKIRIPRDSRNETGKTASEQFRDLLDGYPVQIVKPLGKGEERADALQTVMDDGKIVFIARNWRVYYERGQRLTGSAARANKLDELQRFPAARKDDQVESLIGAHASLARLSNDAPVW